MESEDSRAQPPLQAMARERVIVEPVKTCVIDWGGGEGTGSLRSKYAQLARTISRGKLREHGDFSRWLGGI
jgi:hypothetical protein